MATMPPKSMPGTGSTPMCWQYPIHSIGLNERAVSGSVPETFVDDAPVLPLSHVLITLQGTIAPDVAIPSGVLALRSIGQLNFAYRGVSIWSLTGRDLARVCRAVTRKSTALQRSATRFSTTIIMPFGRYLFDAEECFPRVESGDTTLTVTTQPPHAGMSNLFLTTEFVQLPMAQPTSFLRCTTYSGTAAATGDIDIDLPRAAPLAGVGIKQTTDRVTGTQDGVTSAKLLANGIDTWYPSVTMDALRYMGWWGNAYGMDQDTIINTENLAGTYTQNSAPTPTFMKESNQAAFGYLDFDPTHDDQFILQAQQCSTLILRLNMAVAEAFSIFPVEIWTPSMILPGKCV